MRDDTDTGVDMVLGMCATIRDKNMDSKIQDGSFIERDDELLKLSAFRVFVFITVFDC